MKREWTVEGLIEFETQVADLFKAGKINCPVHLCGGNEEQLIALFDGIKDEDYVISTHRNHYHYLLKGGSPVALLAEILGEKNGCCGGKGRSMHIYDKSINFYTSGIVAGGCAIAVGIALGIKKKYKGKKPHVWCFGGDGAEDSGHYVEAVRFGASRGLPLTFVVEDNDRAVDSTKKERWHQYNPIRGGNIIRYEYEMKYPHVGIGEHVSF